MQFQTLKSRQKITDRLTEATTVYDVKAAYILETDANYPKKYLVLFRNVVICYASMYTRIFQRKISLGIPRCFALGVLY